jgi:hypothetical protein
MDQTELNGKANIGSPMVEEFCFLGLDNAATQFEDT